MERTLTVSGRTLRYELERKRVKNLNLRVRSDGSVAVSAPRLVSAGRVDEFVLSRAPQVFRAQDDFAAKTPALASPEEEKRQRRLCQERVLELCRQVYPLYAPCGIDFPEIKFRKMKSRWGSCNSQKGLLTFNIALAAVPLDCAEYVVYHEFTHFLHPDHSPAFYEALSRFLPDWKARRRRLAEWKL